VLTAGSSILDVHVGRRLAVVRPQSALARVRDAVATAHLDATHKQSLKTCLEARTCLENESPYLEKSGSVLHFLQAYLCSFT